MISYRQETQMAPEPSVKFYKIIALSFLALTIVLLGVVIFMTSKKAAITVVAKADAKRIDLSVEVGRVPVEGKAIEGYVKSESFYWSEVFHPTGNKTVVSQATGEVTLYNKTGADQTLVKTTRLLTAGGVLYRLSDRVTVPANGSIKTKVYADQPGSASEIGPSAFTIPGLNPDKQKVIYADSSEPMKGGMTQVGILSADDLKNAEAGFAEKAKAAYLASAGSGSGAGSQQIITIAGSMVKSDHKAGEEVGAFTISGTSTLIVVSYNGNDLEQLINANVNGRLNAGTEKFLSINKKPEVTISSFDLAKGTAELSVHQDALVTLDSSADSLSAGNFMGRSKDDIQRYVMGLDHVASVNVEFSPGWMMNAPSVPERVKVVVQNVQ